MVLQPVEHLLDVLLEESEGEPLVELGTGGQLGFEPYAAGEQVALRGEDTISVELWTSGLDTTDSMIVSIRTSIGGGQSRDSLATFSLVCNEDEGRGWLSAFPFVPEGAADGDIVTVVATVTDANEVTASGEVDLELSL